ncbi:DUF72 domain-containing protein [Maribrevibacterium harenarium]|uniref:DUF72 domain-containing protein n=1 Tax=Maribrevibacterium harenarium TaxID=2589817 RepID=A0A501WN80_9GAMM|nr:DUF72 domain-containing protein [Maribrevibacterium harenarium]TPE50889.1 DUF72 domain-containing protein [Maribrevibacterium harenarium]
MIYFGMAQWHHGQWRDWIYPRSASATERLSHYASVFNSVEVGSTFYADVAPAQLQQWYDAVPDDFRFVFKAPQTISHHLDDHSPAQLLGLWQGFMDRLAPLADKLGPVMLQFPAQVGPQHLAVIESLVAAWCLSVPLSVEVRHLAFFEKGDSEVALLRMLRDHGANRVVMDSRPVFSTPAYDEGLKDAQAKKPRVPCHAVATARSPVVRFIGHPELSRNEPWLNEWATKISAWLREGREPYVFVHSSDNNDAPLLAQMLEQRIGSQVVLPRAVIRLSDKPEQISLI